MELLFNLQKNNKFKPLVVSAVVFSVLAVPAFFRKSPAEIYAQIGVALFYAFFTGLIFYTGKITLIRKIVFISSAVIFFFLAKALAISFSCTSSLTCPVSVSYTFPHILRNIFSNIKAFGPELPALLLLGAVLFTGRSWCSWACPFGGVDELFSSIIPKPLIKLTWMERYLSELPAAVLILSALAAFSTGTAFFCIWLCPLKTTPSFLVGIPTAIVAQIILFILIAAVFLVILPLLSKKRSFCRFLCPMRGLLRWTTNFHPASVSIDRSKCTPCGICSAICPSLAVKDNKIGDYCNLCLACYEKCPEDAVNSKPGIPLLLLLSMIFSGLATSILLRDLIKLWSAN